MSKEHIGKKRQKIWEKQAKEKGLLEKDRKTIVELQKEVDGGIRHYKRHKNDR